MTAPDPATVCGPSCIEDDQVRSEAAWNPAALAAYRSWACTDHSVHDITRWTAFLAGWVAGRAATAPALDSESPTAELLRELDTTLAELERAERNLRERADQAGVNPHHLMDSSGQRLLAPLLIARAQVVTAMVGLR